MRFSDQDADYRMAVRKSVYLCGGDVISYCGNGFKVAVKQGRYADLVQSLAAWGFHNTDLAYFPLCSDAPEMAFRHDWKGQKACMWLYAHFEAK